MRLEVRGARLFFDTEGSEWIADGPQLRRKPTLLILHGGPGVDHSAYREMGRRLRDELHVVYLDHRGNGRSDEGTADAWTLASWAADVAAFVDVLGLERPFVLGHSFGGYVAQAYAASFPGQAAGVILAGTAPRFVLARCLETVRRLGGEGAADVARRFFARPRETFPEYVATCYPLYGRTPPDADGLARTVIRVDVADHFVGGEMQTFDLRPALAAVASPVLILSGGDDLIATPQDIDELVAALPAGRVTRAHQATAGHEMLRDAPAETEAAIRAFVRDVSGSGR